MAINIHFKDVNAKKVIPNEKAFYGHTLVGNWVVAAYAFDRPRALTSEPDETNNIAVLKIGVVAASAPEVNFKYPKIYFYSQTNINFLTSSYL